MINYQLVSCPNITTAMSDHTFGAVAPEGGTSNAYPDPNKHAVWDPGCTGQLYYRELSWNFTQGSGIEETVTYVFDAIIYTVDQPTKALPHGALNYCGVVTNADAPLPQQRNLQGWHQCNAA